jgi:hypothetical protein
VRIQDQEPRLDTGHAELGKIMRLYEFFGKPNDVLDNLDKKREDQAMTDDVFWFIVDHDLLHKDHFHPIAVKIKKKPDDTDLKKEFLPMVEKGCMEFHHFNKIQGHPETMFTKEFKKDLCEKLYNHYREDIVKDNYKIGV